MFFVWLSVWICLDALRLCAVCPYAVCLCAVCLYAVCLYAVCVRLRRSSIGLGWSWAFSGDLARHRA